MGLPEGSGGGDQLESDTGNVELVCDDDDQLNQLMPGLMHNARATSVPLQYPSPRCTSHVDHRFLGSPLSAATFVLHSSR